MSQTPVTLASFQVSHASGATSDGTPLCPKSMSSCHINALLLSGAPTFPENYRGKKKKAHDFM